MVDRRKLDKLGISVPLLGFGCMRFPTNNDNYGDINMEETEKLLDFAIQNGVNYFDTAFMYHEGHSETALGKLLKKYPREDLLIATKLPIGEVKEDSDVAKILETQLSKLQTDYIDFYLLHGIGKVQFDAIEKFKILEKLEQFKKDGKIKYIGFSFHDNLEVFKESVDMYDWDFCMIQLNYVDTDFQQGIEGYNILSEKGIPTIVMEPLKGGNLASYNPTIAKLFEDMNPNATIASYAVRWLASLPNVKVVLSGMSDMEQLADNINNLTDLKPITPEEDETLKRVKQMVDDTQAVGCTDCKYCMPCPVGVDIAAAFRDYNTYVRYENETRFKWFMGHARENKKSADLCTACGACVPKCPQKIDIPAKLNEMLEIEKRLG
ncbi:MAG: aldo/keto reductase [Oscillospiraceae bacterium]|nr:aldo/keto reductase [Oscillospiraceae bacterium]